MAQAQALQLRKNRRPITRLADGLPAVGLLRVFQHEDERIVPSLVRLQADVPAAGPPVAHAQSAVARLRPWEPRRSA